MVGLVSVSGFAALEDVRSEERVTNGVRSFEVLATNVDEVAADEVPSRTTTIQIDGTSLSVGSKTVVEIHIPAEGYRRTVETHPLVLSDGDGSQIVYENGAVIRSDRDGQVMARSPKPLVTADYARFEVIRTRPVATTSVGGQNTATVRTTRNGTDVETIETSGDTVYFNVTGSRQVAWQRSLESGSQTSCTAVGSDTVSCEIMTDETAVSVTSIDVRLDD
jgi:hypothetical protein